MRTRIFYKFVLAFFAVILAATVLLDFLISRQFEQSYTETLRQDLQEKAYLAADRLAEAPAVALPAPGGNLAAPAGKPAARAANLPAPAGNPAAPTGNLATSAAGSEGPRADLEKLAHRISRLANARVTLIRPDGTVLADSEADPAAMENHARRPEFLAALHGKVGSSARLSRTVHISFLYVAIPLASGPWQGGALRLAYPLAELDRKLAGIRRRIVIGSGLAVLAAMLLAAALAASISRRLHRVVDFVRAVARGDLSARIPVDGRDEISLLMTALNQTADRLEESFSRLAESSRQLESVLEAMEEGVIAIDAQRTVLCANRALGRLLGAEIKPGAALDRAIRNPEIIGALDRALHNHAATVTDVRQGEPPRSLKMSCSPMLAVGRQPSGAVAVLHDVTDLERLENMRRDFVANVSHELRTPLTSIQGYAETLLENGMLSDSGSRDFVEIIRKHAVRMAKLTADLLTLSRIELGRHEFRFAPLQAADAVEWAIESVRQVAQARGVDLVVESVAGNGCVMADSDAVHQVLLNLLDNALKYTPAGGRVTVSVRPAGGLMEFCVSDTGIGIAPEHLPRLFERFYRVDKARSRELGGTGLGLSIVKHIARAHGGDVRVESEPGRGSSFHFTLPLAAAQPVEAG